VVRCSLFGLKAGKPLAGEVEIDLLFNLPVRQILEKLQKHHITVAVAEQLADEA